ncbi:MAG: hypothetical protein ACRC8A_20050 [Microcoleaceae cyanobacterium]
MLTVGAAFGSVVEGAVGVTQTGSGAKGGSFDEITLDYSFKLFPTATDADPRNRRGSFSNVITDFTGSFEEDINNRFTFNSPLKISEPLTLNLNTVLFDRRIEYILSGDDLENKGITELALIIDEESSDFPPLFSNIDSLDSSRERRQAVNSLEYIINEQLLELVNTIRVSGPSFSNPDVIVSVPSNASDTEAEIITIPEVNSSNSLLVLGALGVGLGVKRRFQMK